jgi:hypothetical protein
MAIVSGAGAGGSTAVTGSAIASLAESLVGDKYVYGGTNPATGLDCSGLVQWVLTKLGFQSVPRTSYEQYAWATKVNASDVTPGTLVFANFPQDTGPSPGHVGIALGGGKVLSAEDPAQGVGIDSLSDWSGYIVGYGKVPKASYAGENASSGPSGSGNPQGNDPWSTTAVSFPGSPWPNFSIADIPEDIISGFGTAGSIAGSVADLAKTASTIGNDLVHVLSLGMWLFEPQNWMRLGALAAGIVLFGGGVYFLVRATGASPSMSGAPIPIPVPV